MFSSEIAWETLDKTHTKTIYLSPLADTDEKMWDSFLKEQFSLHPKKLITSILSERLPRRFVDAFVTEFFSDIGDTFVASISRKDREKIAELLGK